MKKGEDAKSAMDLFRELLTELKDALAREDFFSSKASKIMTMSLGYIRSRFFTRCGVDNTDSDSMKYALAHEHQRGLGSASFRDELCRVFETYLLVLLRC